MREFVRVTDVQQRAVCLMDVVCYATMLQALLASSPTNNSFAFSSFMIRSAHVHPSPCFWPSEGRSCAFPIHDHSCDTENHVCFFMNTSRTALSLLASAVS